MHISDELRNRKTIGNLFYIFAHLHKGTKQNKKDNIGFIATRMFKISDLETRVDVELGHYGCHFS